METGERLAHIEGQLAEIVPRLDRIQAATEAAKAEVSRVVEEARAEAAAAVAGFHVALTAATDKLENRLDEIYLTRAEFAPVKAGFYTIASGVILVLIGWAFKVLFMAGAHVEAASATGHG